MSQWLGWLGAIIAIGFLIVVHEAGHYVVARLCKMRVERFSIGFGPALIGWRSKKSGTLFQIAPIPFGGFVEIRGMNLAEDVDPNDVHAYPNRPAWQRFLTIFAGPGTNYLAAVVLAFGLYSSVGVKNPTHFVVRELITDSAAKGVLEPQDVILAVDGKPTWFRNPSGEYGALSTIVNAKKGAPLTLTVKRGEQTLDLTVTPKLHKTGSGPGAYMLGISLDEEDTGRRSLGVLGNAREAVMYPVEQTKVIVVGLYEWIRGRAEGEVHGPVGMAGYVKKAIEAGWIDAIGLVMVLNVWLGLFNLFPLPALDGGRLAFLGYEMATRRRANPRIETPIHMIGIIILMVVMVVVTVKDCMAL